MKKVLLIIEKGPSDQLWGRITIDDNLIADEAASLPALQRKMKKLLQDFHDLKPLTYDFDLAYDLTALFSEKKYLNLSEVAAQAGINRSLMAQYAAGTKFPSIERAIEIEKSIHQLGRDLMEVKLALKGRSLKSTRTAAGSKKMRQKAKA